MTGEPNGNTELERTNKRQEDRWDTEIFNDNMSWNLSYTQYVNQFELTSIGGRHVTKTILTCLNGISSLISIDIVRL